MHAVELTTLGGGTSKPAWQRLSTSAASSDHRPHAVQSPRPQSRAGLRLAACCGCVLLCGILSTVLVGSLHGSKSTGGGSGNTLNDFLETRLTLPPGFFATTYNSKKVPDARSMALSGGANGGATLVYVGNRAGPNVHVLIDRDSDGHAEETRLLIGGLDHPNGVTWLDGALYVMTDTLLLRYANIDTYALSGEVPPKPVKVSDFLKDTDPRGHAWKYMRASPDGQELYIAVGSPCNKCTCEPLGPVRYCTIARIRLDGTQPQVYASGIRNTVGMTFHPDTGELWYTSNGSDHFGDDAPDDGLVRAARNGTDLGFPTCESHGQGPGILRQPGSGEQLYDPDWPPPGQDTADEVAGKAYCNSDEILRPVQTLGPHVAALGVTVYTGKMFPRDYDRSFFVAEHGSWRLKRKDDIGHRVVQVKVDASGRATSHSIFASGWATNSGTPEQDFWGRPVDLLQMPDGALLVSDDHGGSITRIAYQGR